jgi:glycosyltransferase involved in cell wall biosynthesis
MSYFFIVVPAYNAGKWIRRCLTSIEKQYYPKDKYKVIMIDDCSEDNTWQVMQEFDFIKIRNQIHTGSAIQNMIDAVNIGKPDMEDIMMIIGFDELWNKVKQKYLNINIPIRF